MIKLKKIYLCDPDKNEECTHDGCLFGFGKDGYCAATTNKKYAVRDPHNGKPILLPEFNLIDFDNLCQRIIDRGREQWVKVRIDDKEEK